MFSNFNKCPIKNISEFFTCFEINEENKFMTKDESINENEHEHKNKNIFHFLVDEKYLLRFSDIVCDKNANEIKYEEIKKFINSNFTNVGIRLLYRGAFMPNGVKELVQIKGPVSTSKNFITAEDFSDNCIFIFVLQDFTCGFNYLLDLNVLNFSSNPLEDEVVIVPTIELLFKKEKSFVIPVPCRGSLNISILVMVDPENIDSIDLTKDNTTTLPIDISTGIFKIKTL